MSIPLAILCTVSRRRCKAMIGLIAHLKTNKTDCSEAHPSGKSGKMGDSITIRHHHADPIHAKDKIEQLDCVKLLGMLYGITTDQRASMMLISLSQHLKATIRT